MKSQLRFFPGGKGNEILTKAGEWKREILRPAGFRKVWRRREREGRTKVLGEEERKEKEEERKEEEENDSLLFDYYTGWILEFLEDSSIFPHCPSVELPEWEAGKESPSSLPVLSCKIASNYTFIRGSTQDSFSIVPSLVW